MAWPVEGEIGVVTVEYNVTNNVHGHSPGYNTAMLRVASPHIQYNVTNCAARPGNYTARRTYRATPPTYRAAPYAYRAAPAGNNVNRVNYNNAAALSRTVNYNAAPAGSNSANRVAPPAYYNNAAPVGGNNVNHAVLPAFYNAATRTENNNTAPTENNSSNRTDLRAYYNTTPGGNNNANHVVPPAYYNAAPVEKNNAEVEGNNSTYNAVLEGGYSTDAEVEGNNSTDAVLEGDYSVGEGGYSTNAVLGRDYGGVDSVLVGDYGTELCIEYNSTMPCCHAFCNAPPSFCTACPSSCTAMPPPPFASGSDRHGSQQQQPSAPRPSGAGVPSPSTSHQPSAFGYAPPSNGGYYYRPHVEYNNVKCNCSQCHPWVILCYHELVWTMFYLDVRCSYAFILVLKVLSV